jgi:UDP-N-acetylmuramoyl-L-alanyl-D-glutamate--2,6-diaminopimelate ligase
MKLRELIAGSDVIEVAGGDDAEIRGLAYDHAGVSSGALFFCVVGGRADGHDFAAAALERGAAALVVERPLDLPAPQVRVPDARAAMGPIAVRFWGDPTARLRVAGVTGTNGKTTTAYCIRHILESNGVRTGLLGTVKRVVGGAEEEVERTTPEAIDLQATFRRMLDAGDAACAMEVSSHALALGRAAGTRFAVGVFTNLTQDHLDFHGAMEDYFQAKRGMFMPAEGRGRGAADDRPRVERALVNIDDPYGARLAAELAGEGDPPASTFSPSGSSEADYRALDAVFDASGSRFLCAFPGGEVEVRTPLAGHFNVENALAALAATNLLGTEPAAGAAALRTVGRVPGRFEPVEEGQPFAVLVDYAHTPDSLENVLVAARRLTEGRLTCVFGCGGDRDLQKRPLMGEIAARLSDLCVVTSDNPRSEEPEAIIAQILIGIPGGDGREDVVVEPDRRRAIALALGRAERTDAVVIAGKGHEQGQEFEGGRKVPFDDRQVAREALSGLASASLGEG